MPRLRRWNSLVETVVREPTAASGPGRARVVAGTGGAEPTPLSQIGEAAVPRLQVGIDELDRVLGGGLVAGSLVLLGGEPGIGKSTLLLQAAAGIAKGPGRTPMAGEVACCTPREESPARSGCGRAPRPPRGRPANGSTSSPRARSSGSSSSPRSGRRPWSSWTPSRPPPSTSSTGRPGASGRSASRRFGSWSWPRARVSRWCSSVT